MSRIHKSFFLKMRYNRFSWNLVGYTLYIVVIFLLFVFLSRSLLKTFFLIVAAGFGIVPRDSIGTSSKKRADPGVRKSSFFCVRVLLRHKIGNNCDRNNAVRTRSPSSNVPSLFPIRVLLSLLFSKPCGRTDFESNLAEALIILHLRVFFFFYKKKTKTNKAV